MKKGAICGTLAGIGTVSIIMCEELPVVPMRVVWQAIGLALVCIGVWVPLFEIVRGSR